MHNMIKVAAAPMSIILFKQVILADGRIEDFELSHLFKFCSENFDIDEISVKELFDSAPMIDDLELFAAQTKYIFSKELIAKTISYMKDIAESDGIYCDREKAVILNIIKAFA